MLRLFTALPVPDASVDRVMASEVLEHIPDDVTAMAEIARVLKPGGRVAVTVPRYGPERICWALSDEYHANEGGHVRIYRRDVVRTQRIDRRRAPRIGPAWRDQQPFIHAVIDAKPAADDPGNHRSLCARVAFDLHAARFLRLRRRAAAPVRHPRLPHLRSWQRCPARP